MTGTSAASEWVSPSMRPAHINQLIEGVDRYNPQNLEALHQYLSQQLDEGGYDCLANLAILKLYQFNPDSFNYEVVINILTKAMLSVAYPDFNLCLSLLGEAPIPMDSTPFSGKAAAGKDEEGKEGEKKEGGKSTEAPAAASASASAAAAAAAAAEGENKVPLAGSITDPLILRLANLSQLLQTSRFREFWATLYEDDDYDDVRGYTQNVARFEEEVRKAVMDAVGTTFTRISEERLARYLHLEQGKQLDEFLQAAEQEGWKKEKDGSSGKNMVVAPANSSNEIKALVVNEDIPVEQLSKLFAQAQPTPLRAAQ